MTTFHGHIVLEQRDPNPLPDRPWQDINTQLAKVEVRGGTPTEVLFALADHLAALIKQSPDPAVRKQATDIMRIGLAPQMGAGVVHDPANGTPPPEPPSAASGAERTSPALGAVPRDSALAAVGLSAGPHSPPE